jgi:predicted ATPase
MIKSWSLESFKSVDGATIGFAPLTIFAGANSSGKSTLIQSILVTAQTLQSPVVSRPVILNGHIVRLGAFNDIVSHGSRRHHIAIGFDLAPGPEVTRVPSLARRYYGTTTRRAVDNLANLSCRYAFSAEGGQDDQLLQLQPRLDEVLVTARTVIDSRIVEQNVHIKRSKDSAQKRASQFNLPPDVVAREDISALEYEVVDATATSGSGSLRRPIPIGRTVGAMLHHFLPFRLARVYDEVEEQCRRMTEAFVRFEEYRYMGVDEDEIASTSEKFSTIVIHACREVMSAVAAPTTRLTSANQAMVELEQNFSLENFHAFRRWLSNAQRQALAERLAELAPRLQEAARSGRPPEYAMGYVPVPELAAWSIDYTQHFFTSLVKYLGPLRDEPKPVYPLAGATDPRDVGFRGEHTAAVLDVHRYTQVTYLPSEVFAKGQKEWTQKRKVSLLRAVVDWLEYMGVACKVETHDKGKLGHELQVAIAGESALHDLTHVGVGVSQVLPILVLSLLAEEGSTLVFEQPELHLHPRVQTRLADFFLSMTLLNKQCVVETHSEYLINRLRLQTAKAAGDEIAEAVVIYFVENERGVSNYRPLHINRYGVIDDWPKGFFDEAEETATALIQAGMQKRSKESQGKNG